MELTGKLLLGDSFVKGSGGSFKGFNPTTSMEMFPEFYGASVEEVSTACRLADESFQAFRATSLEERANFLETVADELEKLKSSIVARGVQETGLPEGRLQGELGRTTGQLRLFANVVRDGGYLDVRIDEAMPDRTPPRPDLRLVNIPVGPVVVFGASNFPLAFSVAGGDTASAWAAGCPVIVKAHSAHPGTSELVAKAIAAAVKHCNMPTGVFSMLFAASRDVGTALVADPRVKAVGFTGSRQGGLALQAIAQSRAEPIPVYAEMSSINPVILMPEAMQQKAAGIAQAFVGALTIGAGQFCTNPGLVLAVEDPSLELFKEEVAKGLANSAAATMLTAGICEAYQSGVRALKANQHVSCVGEGMNAEGVVCQAHVFEVDGANFLADETLQDEVFGAASLIVKCESVSQLREIITILEGQLTISVHADAGDEPEVRALLPLLMDKAGRVLFDGFGTGVEVCDAMVHGGPYPSTTAPATSSVGSIAIKRFLRPVCFQNLPPSLMMPEISSENSAGIPQRVNGGLKIG